MALSQSSAPLFMLGLRLFELTLRGEIMTGALQLHTTGASQKRGVALVAAMALTVALAGCGARGTQGQNAYGTGGMSAGASSGSSAITILQVQSVDQQVQNALGGLDNTENSATSADSMSQEGTALP